jgi:hypothetical protein
VFGAVIVNLPIETARIVAMVTDDGASGRVPMITFDFDDRIVSRSRAMDGMVHDRIVARPGTMQRRVIGSFVRRMLCRLN